MNLDLLEHADNCYELTKKFVDTVIARDYKGALDLYTELTKEYLTMSGNIDSELEGSLKRIAVYELDVVNTLGDYIKNAGNNQCETCRKNYIEKALEGLTTLINDRFLPAYSERLEAEIFKYVCFQNGNNCQVQKEV